jgi:ubiquinone/menaquinone biosynthesis C-methylase UbiE
MKENIKDWAENWNELGKEDPMYIVLTQEGKEGNKWSEKEFFLTGEEEIKAVLEKAKKHTMQIQYEVALDFGCGVGRLSQALSKYFKKVEAIDISRSMIEKAKQYDKTNGKIEFHLNISDDISIFQDGKFDFIYSNITLQHIPQEFSKNYIKEFLRVLKPGGNLIFQIPSEPRYKDARNWLFHKLNPRWIYLYRKLRYGKIRPAIDMHAVPKMEIEKIVKDNNGMIIKIEENDAAEPHFSGYTYFVIKNNS